MNVLFLCGNFLCAFVLRPLPPSGAWGFFLALCSRITHGRLGGPSGVLRIKPGSIACKANVISAVLILKPMWKNFESWAIFTIYLNF